jgi:asparagine synthase (glutamine-hydrolysing)
MHRLTCMRGPTGNRATRFRLDSLRDALIARGYVQLIDRRGVIVLLHGDARDAPPVHLSDEGGVVVGPMFAEGQEAERIAAFDRSEELEILRSGGAGLIGRYWGYYLAVLVDRERDRVIVVRDPSGGRPCFARMYADEVRVFATHPADVPGEVAIDQVRLAGFLSHGRLSLDRTGVVGLEEVTPGEAWMVGRAGEKRTQYWRPLGRVARSEGPQDRGEAVRRAIEATAEAFTSGERRVLHRLSGGLDSSIVLSALAKARERHGFQLSCVNEYALEAPEGDERALARATAARFGAELMEIEFRRRAWSEARATQSWSPVPGLQVLNAAAADFIDGMSRFDGALLTSGQGGDHLFQRNRTLHLGADAQRHGALRFDLAMALARMAGVSVWRIWSHALGFGLLRGRLPQREYVKPNPIGNPELTRAAIAEHFAHPWLEGWRGAPTAEVLRALHVLEATHYHAHSLMHEAFNPAPLLVSQKVMEACLAVPTYVMAPGQERGLVRRTYAAILPPEVLARVTKGETTRFFVAQLDAQWGALRETLLGGHLAQQAALERAKLETILSARRVTSLDAGADVMTCLAAELWLRSLLG